MSNFKLTVRMNANEDTVTIQTESGVQTIDRADMNKAQREELARLTTDLFIRAMVRN